jgi:hypothetical protein
VLALLATVGAFVGALAVVAYGNPGAVVPQEVATVGSPAQAEPQDQVVERTLAAFSSGPQLRADAQAEQDAALAAAAQMAEQEAAAQAAAEEQAAADAAAEADAAAAAEQQSAAIEFAAALAEAEAAPAPSPTQPAAPPAVQGDPFDALAQCESGRNPNAVNPAGPYYGAFQFSQGTWDSVAPDMPGRPTDYGYAQQKVAAQRLQAARGWAPWPHCARQLGLM